MLAVKRIASNPKNYVFPEDEASDKNREMKVRYVTTVRPRLSLCSS